jgi:hypothetical protein
MSFTARCAICVLIVRVASLLRLSTTFGFHLDDLGIPTRPGVMAFAKAAAEISVARNTTIQVRLIAIVQ